MASSTRPQVGIDLGRHRSYLTVDTGAGPEVVRLSAHHEGMVVRYATGRGPSGRPLDVLGHSQDPAAVQALAADVVRLVVAPVAHDPVLVEGSLTLAAPAGWDLTRRLLLAGAARGLGSGAGPVRVVARSEAALAAWLAQRGDRPAPGGLVVVVDVDGGACSASVADVGSGGLVVTADLGLHLGLDRAATDRFGLALRRLVGITAVLARPQAPPWPAFASLVAVVATSGTGAGHPALDAVLSSLFPASDRTNALGQPALAVAAGLVCADRLDRLRLQGPVPVSGPEAVGHVQPELGREPQGLDVDPLVVAVEPAEELPRAH